MNPQVLRAPNSYDMRLVTLPQEECYQKENKIPSQECGFSFQISPTLSSRLHGMNSVDLHLSFGPFHTVALPRQAKN